MKIDRAVRHALMILWALVSGMVATAAAEEESKSRSHYHLTFYADTPRLVSVEAEVTVSRQKIKMFLYGQPFLEDGWATWVEDLAVTTSDGTPVEASLIEEGWGSWSVDVEDGTVVNLSYNVHLTHDEYDWDSVGGQDGRPTWKDDAFFGVTRAFFIYSYSDEEMTVRIDKPDSWLMAAPWREYEGEDNLFFVPNLNSLVSNALVLGDFDRRTAKSGEMRIILALDKEISAHGSELISVLHTQLDEYARIFDGTPAITYVVAIRAADEDDGESFYTSFNQVTLKDKLGGPRIVWGSVISHEMFHFWNGGNFLRGTDKATVEWFSEGFTEYYTSLSMFRTRLIDEETYYKKLERYLARYYMTTRRWPEERLSLVAAGKDKQKNWFFIYGGGATVALALDLDIRDRTGGEKSLDDVMLLLKRRFGDAGATYTVQDVLDAVNEVSGADYTEFFDKYIRGSEEYLNIEPYLAKVGIRVDTFSDEFYLSKELRKKRTREEIRQYKKWVR